MPHRTDATSYPFSYSEIGLNLKELGHRLPGFCVSPEFLAPDVGADILATAANAVDHAIERRVLPVDWIVRIRQVFRRHLIGARLTLADRCIRQQLLARVRR